MSAEKTIEKSEEEFDPSKLPDSQDIEKTNDTKDDEEAAPSPEEVIEKLKADMAAKEEELKQARERTTKLTKEKDDAITTTATAQETAIQLHERSIASAIEAETIRLSNIKRDLKEARARGDEDREFDLQADLSGAAVALENAKLAKSNFETWKANETARKERAPVQKYTPETQKWIESHPRFNTDREYQAEALAGDAAAQSLGYQPDTPAYFNYINDRLTKRFEENDGRHETNRSETQTRDAPRKKPLPSAAVSREGSTSGTNIRSYKDIQLTPEQKEAAEITGVSEEEYKMGLMKIKQEKR